MMRASITDFEPGQIVSSKHGFCKRRVVELGDFQVVLEHLISKARFTCPTVRFLKDYSPDCLFDERRA